MIFKDLHIVLVGSTKFPDDDSLHPIPNVLANITSLQDIFLDNEIIGVPQDNIHIVVDKTTSKTSIDIRKIVNKLDESQTVVFYYSGHGILSKIDFNLYLSTIETDSDHVEFTCLGIDKVYDILKKSKPKKKVIILDCCHSGKILGTMSSKETVIQNQIDKFTGLYIMTSTDEFSLATYEVNNPNVPTNFTKNFIDVLKEGVDNRDSLCRISDVYDELIRKYEQEGETNLPQQGSKEYGHNILIAKNKKYSKANIFKSVDELIEHGEFKKAENELFRLISILGDDTEIEQKISLLQTERDFIQFSKDADNMFYAEEYEKALDLYEKAISIKKDLPIKIKINECKKYIKIERKYKTKYGTNQLEDEIKKIEEKYSEKFREERKKLIEDATEIIKIQVEQIVSKFLTQSSLGEVKSLEQVYDNDELETESKELLSPSVEIATKIEVPDELKIEIGKLLRQLQLPASNLAGMLQSPMENLIHQIQSPQMILISQILRLKAKKTVSNNIQNGK